MTGQSPEHFGSLSASELAVLKEGKYEDPSGQVSVSFTLPSDFREALDIDGDKQAIFEGEASR